MMRWAKGRALALVGMMLVAGIDVAAACPVCFGQTESGSETGLNAAVWLMVGVTGGVLGLLSALFLRFRKRMRMTLNGSVEYPGRN